MIRKILAVGVAAIVALAIPAAASAKTLIGSGSVAAQPVFLALFHKYEQKHSNIHFVYTADGGNAGVQDVQSGKSMFAGQARLPLPSDAGTTYIKMYLDGLCMDVNNGNRVSNMSVSKIRNVYLAHTTNWSNVSGSQLNTTIDPVGRDTNGGTYNFFLQAVLNNNPPASNVNALTSDGLVVNAVKQDKNAIGYAGLAWQGSSIKKIKVNGVPCAPKQIKKFKYPLTRYIFTVVPTKHPDKDVLKWVDWARTSHAAGKIINKAGGVAAFNKGF